MAEICLSRGATALIDDEFLELVSQYRWYLDNGGYAATKIGRNVLKMHRLIARPGDGLEVDHRNGNKLDNRSQNLRVCTHAENMRNRKMHGNNQCGVKGVYKEEGRRGKPYRAQIRVSGTKVNLGSFWTVEEASEAYIAGAKKYHGDFAAT